MPRTPSLNLEYFYNLIYRLLTRGLPEWSWPPAPDSLFFKVTIGLMVVEAAFLVLIVILLIKNVALRREDARERRLLLTSIYPEPKPRNARWEKVLRYLQGTSPAEWKLAIIEADNILDELIEKFPSAKGDNLGERLKSIEPSDFTTLNEAWEAHKIRNRIAHESDFTLTQREAREAIALFKKVFDEFDYLS